MPYQIKWKDGSVSDLSDAEFADLPQEMEADIGEITESNAQEAPLPEVPADTPSDISVVGFANPTTLAKAQRYVESQNEDSQESPSLVSRMLEGASHSPLYEPEYAPGYEPGYESLATGIGRDLNYAAGEEQDSPSLLGRAWRAASQSPLYEHPIETGAGIAAGILTPMSLGALGQMGVTGAAVGAGNVLDQALLDSDTTRTLGDRASEAAGSAMGAGLLSGLGYGIASGMKNYAAPYMKAVSDYAAKTKALEQFKSWLENAPIKSAVAEIRATKRLFPGSSDVDQMVLDQAEMKLQELIDNKIGKDVLETMYQDPDAAEAIANLVSRKMQNELPEYNVFGPMSASPSTGEVGRYILENTQAPKAVIPSEYILPDWLARYAQLKMPSLGAIGEATPLGGMARGIGDYVAPRILPAVDYLAPAVSKGLGSAGGVTGGILGSESTRSVQDVKKDLESRFEMPPVY